MNEHEYLFHYHKDSFTLEEIPFACVLSVKIRTLTPRFLASIKASTILSFFNIHKTPSRFNTYPFYEFWPKSQGNSIKDSIFNICITLYQIDGGLCIYI